MCQRPFRFTGGEQDGTTVFLCGHTYHVACLQREQPGSTFVCTTCLDVTQTRAKRPALPALNVLSPPLNLFCSQSFPSHPLSLSIAPSYPLSLSIAPSHPLSLSIAPSRPLSLSIATSHPLSLSIAPSNPLSLSIPPSQPLLNSRFFFSFSSHMYSQLLYFIYV